MNPTVAYTYWYEIAKQWEDMVKAVFNVMTGD